MLSDFKKFAAPLHAALLLVTPEGRIVAANPAADKILHATQPLAGVSLTDIVLPHTDLTAFLRMCLRSGAPLPTRLLLQDDSQALVGRGSRYSLAHEPLVLLQLETRSRDDAFTVLREQVEALNREILKRKRAEAALLQQAQSLEHEAEVRSAELKDALEALHQSQKMEALGQITGGIAHDFNNMLMSILGSLELIERSISAGNTTNLDRFISNGKRAAQRSADLTHRLLAFARKQPLVARMVNLDSVTDALSYILEQALDHSIILRIETSAELWPICCDPAQLESCLLNLIINARDAMPDGGQIRLQATNVSVAEPTRLKLGSDSLPKGEYVQLSVSDRGKGMTPEVLARAIDPFFTTKAVGQGTGLGLAMVYGFARQSGGGLTITSHPGRGTTVDLFLPRFVGAATNPALPVVEEYTGARQGKAILVVDDEQLVRDAVVTALAEDGHQVLEASDAVSALQIIDNNPTITVLVSDVGMPGMNGYHLAEVARSRRPDIKVLFMTGYASEAIEGKTTVPGAELITKPFSLDEIAQRVRHLAR